MILIAESVTGASHLLAGKECQDSNMSWRSPDGNIVIMAVSDGHGGEKYYNSSKGSAMACEVAIEVLREFCQVKSSGINDSDMRHLSQCCVARWREQVIAIDENVESFGCTLIAYARTPHYSFALQLGDGLLSILDSKGEWQQPIPSDSRCFLNETTSMCDLAAADEFRWVISNTDNTPGVVILSTDGIDNTFCENHHLENFYNRILDSIAEEGPEKVKCQLPKVLSHYSEIGSKDDMTLSILINQPALPVMMYLHGFMSGANGAKQRQLQKMFKGRYLVIAPELSADIESSLQTINTLIDVMEPEIIIGTSLGGFMAMMCHSKGADVVVVNPVTLPCRELRRWLNQEQTYFCKRLDGVQTYTLTKDVLHKYADYKFDESKEGCDRLHLYALCSTADELLGDAHIKLMREMVSSQNLMVVDDFGHQCRDAGMKHLKDIIEKAIARRELNKQAEEDAKNGILRLSNGCIVSCEIDLEKASRPITNAYCKNGFNGVVHEHCRGAAWHEFYKLITYLSEHGSEVFVDGSKFLCPVPISKQMEAVGYAKGLSTQVTLGQYMEWWNTARKALDTNGNRILTFTDTDDCISIDSDGNRVPGHLAYPADEVWQSFLAINARYTIFYNLFKHCSLQDLIKHYEEP